MCYYLSKENIRWSWDPILVLRRGFDPVALAFPSLVSDSSGGSDKGLDVVVNGLMGGVCPSAVGLERDDF